MQQPCHSLVCEWQGCCFRKPHPNKPYPGPPQQAPPRPTPKGEGAPAVTREVSLTCRDVTSPPALPKGRGHQQGTKLIADGECARSAAILIPDIIPGNSCDSSLEERHTPFYFLQCHSLLSPVFVAFCGFNVKNGFIHFRNSQNLRTFVPLWNKRYTTTYLNTSNPSQTICIGYGVPPASTPSTATWSAVIYRAGC